MDYVNEFDKGDDDNNTVPSDVAMAAYINYHHPSDMVTLFNGGQVEKLTQQDLDEQDVIFVIYDAIEVFHCGERKTCPFESKKFERMLAKTTAFVYPHPDFHKYIINKPNYYTDLHRAGIPVAPFFRVTPDAVIRAPAQFKKRILAKGWKGAIIKPSYAGYSLGIKVLKDVARTQPKTISDHFKRLRNKGFPNAVVQEFVPSFAENYEIRTYWINERYAYSVGTLTEGVGGGGGLPISDFDTFVSEGGTLPDAIARQIKPVARKAIRSILQYPIKHPMIRVDFGCCLSNDQCLESYFINEVETMAANMLADHTKYPAVERTAVAAYNFAKNAAKRKNMKGWTPKVAPLLKMPCKTRAKRKSSRKGSRKASRKSSRKGSRKASRKSSRKGSRKASRKSSRKGSRKASRKSSRKGSRKSSRKGSRKVSRKSSRK